MTVTTETLVVDADLVLRFDPEELRERFASWEHPAADASDEVLERIGREAIAQMQVDYDYALAQAAVTVAEQIRKEQ